MAADWEALWGDPAASTWEALWGDADRTGFAWSPADAVPASELAVLWDDGDELLWDDGDSLIWDG